MSDLTGLHIVETEWLAQHTQETELVIVDGSLHMPASGRDARGEFAVEHIPGAQFFDINDIADDTNPLPHMLPSETVFATKMEALGIGDNVAVVAYDSQGLFSAARVWWMLRAMGHENVVVLNGGLPKWKADGHAVTHELTPAVSRRRFAPSANPALIQNVDDVKDIVQNGGKQLIDARSAARFRGEVAEPRAGLRAGHMPGARNVPYLDLQNSNGTLKSPQEIGAIFTAAGIDVTKPTVATCGSGVTACVVSLALAVLGHANTPVYDGSWTEWGDENSGLEVVT